jgi:hypothetical protein
MFDTFAADMKCPYCGTVSAADGDVFRKLAKKGQGLKLPLSDSLLNLAKAGKLPADGNGFLVTLGGRTIKVRPIP